MNIDQQELQFSHDCQKHNNSYEIIRDNTPRRDASANHLSGGSRRATPRLGGPAGRSANNSNYHGGYALTGPPFAWRGSPRRSRSFPSRPQQSYRQRELYALEVLKGNFTRVFSDFFQFGSFYGNVGVFDYNLFRDRIVCLYLYIKCFVFRV